MRLVYFISSSTEGLFFRALSLSMWNSSRSTAPDINDKGRCTQNVLVNTYYACTDSFCKLLSNHMYESRLDTLIINIVYMYIMESNSPRVRVSGRGVYNMGLHISYIFVSPYMGGSKVPPRTLYDIKCVLAVYIYKPQSTTRRWHSAVTQIT